MRRSVSSPCRWNTGKIVENTTHSGVFLTNFEALHLVMKHCVECFSFIDISSLTKWFYHEKSRMQKWAAFHLISKHSLITSSVFSLWIIDEFEKSKSYTNTSSSIYSYSKYPYKTKTPISIILYSLSTS